MNRIHRMWVAVVAAFMLVFGLAAGANASTPTEMFGGVNADCIAQESSTPDIEVWYCPRQGGVGGSGWAWFRYVPGDRNVAVNMGKLGGDEGYDSYTIDLTPENGYVDWHRVSDNEQKWAAAPSMGGEAFAWGFITPLLRQIRNPSIPGVVYDANSFTLTADDPAGSTYTYWRSDTNVTQPLVSPLVIQCGVSVTVDAVAPGGYVYNENATTSWGPYFIACPVNPPGMKIVSPRKNVVKVTYWGADGQPPLISMYAPGPPRMTAQKIGSGIGWATFKVKSWNTTKAQMLVCANGFFQWMDGSTPTSQTLNRCVVMRRR